MARILGARPKLQTISREHLRRGGGVEKKREEAKKLAEKETKQAEEKKEELKMNRREERDKVREMLDAIDPQSSMRYTTIGSLCDEFIHWRVLVAQPNEEAREALGDQCTLLPLEGDDFIFSRYESIDGVPFRLGMRREADRGGRQCAGIYLFCNDNGAAPIHSVTVACRIGHYWPPRPCNVFIPAAGPNGTLLEKESIECHHFTLEARISLISVEKDPPAPFLPPSPLPTDVTILVDGRRFDANKEHLAYYAQYFKAIFSSNFAEGKEKEITLKDIDAGDFENMLDVISTKNARKNKVTASSVTGLLQLADFLDMPVLVKECSKFLQQSPAFGRSEKLLLSEQFRLPELQYLTGQRLKSIDDYKRVIASPEFSQLSDLLQSRLLAEYINKMRYYC